jgi:hypothetical protein
VSAHGCRERPGTGAAGLIRSLTARGKRACPVTVLPCVRSGPTRHVAPGKESTHGHPGRAGGPRHRVDTHKHTHTAAVVVATTGATIHQATVPATHDPATCADAARRRAQGKTNREIKRCLVRYVARQRYRLLETDPTL